MAKVRVRFLATVYPYKRGDEAEIRKEVAEYLGPKVEFVGSEPVSEAKQTAPEREDETVSQEGEEASQGEKTQVKKSDKSMGGRKKTTKKA